MTKSRRFKIFAVIILVYFILILPGFVWPAYFDSTLGLLAAIPFISIYAFHSLGIPYLLQNNGACGWGWCAPSIFGWIFLCSFWLLVVWVLAAGIASMTPKKRK